MYTLSLPPLFCSLHTVTVWHTCMYIFVWSHLHTSNAAITSHVHVYSSCKAQSFFATNVLEVKIIISQRAQ